MKLFRIFSSIILIIVLLTYFYFYSSDTNEKNKISIQIKNQTFILEKAIIEKEKSRGLMYKTLEDNEGMIFIFDNEQSRSFWMKNTLIPLDIIFLDKNNKIVDIKENFQPCREDPCESYQSKPAMYVIELNAGTIEKLEIRNGDIINFSLIK
ncbi:DUF192 domain-containing protein [Candidatus Pacearchaeota archaeon]|nr:DUF192 domain-containing protein [Candidatus Pacearchaeota archaeon]